MRFSKLGDLYENELFAPAERRYWFFQLLVWLDVLAPEIPKCVIETGTNLGYVRTLGRCFLMRFIP